MKHRTRRVIVATAATAVSLGGLSAASAATTEHQVRAGDLSSTAQEGGASYAFLKEGLRLTTVDQEGYAKGYFATDVDLKDVHDVTYEWFGSDYGTNTSSKSTGKPAIYYNVDVDGDGSFDCQLIGEPAYGGKDVWLNRDSENSPEQTLDPGTCASKSPDEPGGSGADAHGDLDDWATTLKTIDGQEPVVVESGFLASGLVMDGVLRSISLGDDQYLFTGESAALPPSDVTATATITRSGSLVKVRVVADPTPDGKSEGAPAEVQVLQGPKGGALANRGKGTVHAGEVYSYIASIPSGNNQRVQVTINGEKVAALQIP